MRISADSSTQTAPAISPVSSVTLRPERIGLTGPSVRLDPRNHAYRKDVADVALAGRLFAPHYAEPLARSLTVADSMIFATPSLGARAVSQIVFGEVFYVLDVTAGWAWGRCGHDDYVGYIPVDRLGPTEAVSHRVSVPVALVFAEPDIKAPVVGRWPVGARFAAQVEGDFLITKAGYLHVRHAAAWDELFETVDFAERLIGQPYLWGGRGGGGIDCSGLVQVALAFAGIDAPRDSDMQRDRLGALLSESETLMRGDLVFFPGHVGLMVDSERLIHANAHAMAVTVEPLADIVERLRPHHMAPVTARRRLA